MSFDKWILLGFRDGFEAGKAVTTSENEGSSLTLPGIAAAILAGLLLRLIWKF